MERHVLGAIRDLIGTRQVLGLAVIADGDPEASLLPYAVRPDHSAVFAQAFNLGPDTFKDIAALTAS